MNEATGGNRAHAWIGKHPLWTVVITAVLTFLMGIGVGGGSSLEANLLSAQADKRTAEAEAAAEIDALMSEIASLESERNALELDAADLEDQVLKLNAQRELPSLVGALEAFASKLESKYGWDLTVTSKYSTSKAGTILSQTPAAGTMMRYGAPFRVVIAKEIPKLPSFVGMTKDRAARLARDGDWNVVFVEQISSDKPGTVLSMSPSSGARLLPGSTITLTIAKKAPPPPPAPSTSVSSGSGCTAGYSPCLPLASDYDCAGGSGDGPKYTGFVTVTGSDPYGLDSDGDGSGCES